MPLCVPLRTAFVLPQWRNETGRAASMTVRLMRSVVGDETAFASSWSCLHVNLSTDSSKRLNSEARVVQP